MSNMPWYAWAVLVFLTLTAARHVVIVGKPRSPLSGWEALEAVIECALGAWVIVTLAT